MPNTFHHPTSRADPACPTRFYFPSAKVMLSRHVSPRSTSPISLRLLNTRSPSTKKTLSHAKLLLGVSVQHYHQPSSSTSQNSVLNASPNLSDLGVRSQRPPDSIPNPNSNPTPETPPEEISDQEWEIRTGRAIYVIQETLPEFFQTGLITSINKVTGAPQPPHSLAPIANINFLEPHVVRDEDEAIYSPHIRLSYTPPVVLPPPFPKTFHVEGIQLYVASSSFIRHTLMALYSDLTVQNVKLVIDTPSNTNPSLPPSPSSEPRKINREKSILLRQIVSGTARVSGKPGEWEIESTYSFSPITGLINQHVINAIHPAPHQAVYDSLRLGLGKILGLQWPGGSGATPSNGTAFKRKVEGGKSG